MFDNSFFIKRRMERPQMERFAEILGSIWKNKVLSNTEGRDH
jgi:hypothetical protein